MSQVIDFQKPFSIPDMILTVTLIVLIWQTWLLRRTMQSNTFQSVYDRYFDLDLLFIQYPEFQKYGTREEVYNQIKDLGDQELRKKSFIELLLDLCEFIYYQKKLGTYPVEITYIDRVMTNPHVKQYWNTVRGTYKMDFVEYVDKCFAKQEESKKNEAAKAEEE